jgi:hypothetical protein
VGSGRFGAVDEVDPLIRELLAAYPRMPATVIASESDGRIHPNAQCGAPPPTVGITDGQSYRTKVAPTPKRAPQTQLNITAQVGTFIRIPVGTSSWPLTRFVVMSCARATLTSSAALP